MKKLQCQFLFFKGLHLRNCSTEKEWTENVLGAEEIEIFTEHINCTTLYVTADSLKTNLCFSITVSITNLFCRK